MRNERDPFIQVLIDRIVDDVREELAREFAEERNPSRDGETESNRPATVPTDMIAKLLDWQTRSAPHARHEARVSHVVAPLRANHAQTYKSEPSHKQEPLPEQPKPQPAPAPMRWIALDSAESIFALATVTKFGAKFSEIELFENRLSVPALERERRKLLFQLHPDRTNSGTTEFSPEKRTQKFIEAHEALETLRAAA